MSHDLFAYERGTSEASVKISMPDADVLHFARLFDPCEANSSLTSCISISCIPNPLRHFSADEAV